MWLYRCLSSSVLSGTTGYPVSLRDRRRSTQGLSDNNGDGTHLSLSSACHPEELFVVRYALARILNRLKKPHQTYRSDPSFGTAHCVFASYEMTGPAIAQYLGRRRRRRLEAIVRWRTCAHE